MSDAAAQDELGKRSGVRREETESGQSQVYTATRDTFVSKKITHTGAHALVSMCC